MPSMRRSVPLLFGRSRWLRANETTLQTAVSADMHVGVEFPGMVPSGPMKTRTTDYGRSARRWAGVFAWLSLVSAAGAQPARIADPLDVSKTKVLAGNRPPQARPRDDQGPLDPSQRISGITLVLKPSASQTADLEKLLEQQRNPSSPDYRRWLTPEEYADRFGLSRHDLEQVVSWLKGEGFRIDYAARGRTWIMFSGTAGQVQAAFRTELHRYNVNGQFHFANATDPSVPAALAPLVLIIRGLDDFHAKPRVAVADFTSGGGGHSLVPGDLATIYNIGPLYQGGITGTGQKIAVVGQTDINLSDIQHFRSQFGSPANNPELLLVPGSANPGTSADDLIESSLDLEYSGGIAPNATIVFVYSSDVWTSIEYAVDEDVAPVISTSYGYCEPQISNAPATTAAYLQSVAEQANSFGITWLAASGDAGAADCDPTSEQVATQGLAVDLPASVPEVTGVGGTEFMEGSGNYWSATNNSNGSSALSYIPEMAWNDTAAIGTLLATGGGASIFFAKPSWQTGPGVPNDHVRDVPDVALAAAVAHDPYQIYVNGETVYVGGTSAPTPVFSGVLALLNQYLVSVGSQAQPGLGNINPALYRLAQSTPAIFHDVTVGSNVVPCANGSPNCTGGQLGYYAGAGYDQTTGLGSVNAYNLVTLWNGSQPVATTTIVAASHSSISAGSSTLLTATVTAASGTTLPTGSVSFTHGQTALGTVALSVSGGVATAALEVAASELSSGANTILATYAGSGSFTGSSASISITVATATVAAVSVAPNSGSGSSQTFAFVFSDSAGASDISSVQIVIDSSLTGASSCYFYLFASGANVIYLANNAGALQSGLAVGSAGTVQNSQCSLNVGASSVTSSGTTFTLNLALSFAPSFAGAKNIYMSVENATLGSGWVQEGAWTVPASSGPAPVSVTPNGGSGSPQNFAFTFSDPAGAADISSAQIVINSSLSGTNGCYFYLFASGSNVVYLASNAGVLQSGLAVGSAGTLQNSQCSLNVGASSVSLSGNTFTLNLVLAFTPAFAGAKNIYMSVQNATHGSGWVQEGTWTVPASSGPTPVSVTPNSGSGASQTFAFAFSDPAGAADISSAQIVISSSLSGTNGCYFYLFASGSNVVYLANNAGDLQPGLAIGSAGTLSNSQCSLNVAASSVSLSGNTFTLNLVLTFTSAFAGAKNIYMSAQNATLSSSWVQEGTWTVPGS
jgi:hypothetical protein